MVEVDVFERTNQKEDQSPVYGLWVTLWSMCLGLDWSSGKNLRRKQDTLNVKWDPEINEWIKKINRAPEDSLSAVST